MTQKLVIAPSGTVVNNIPRFSTTTGQIEDSGLAAGDMGPDAASVAEMETGTATDVYTSPGRQERHDGHPKAWYWYNQSGVPPTVLSSYNVSSITDVSAGTYTVNFSITFSSTAECAAAMSISVGFMDPAVSSLGATTAGMYTNNYAGTATDINSSAFFFGDI